MSLNILNEGGLYGHLAHLYDNTELSFKELKEIFLRASGGDLFVAEKMDGMNIFLSYSSVSNQTKAARNKGNIKSGGLNGEELIKKFSDKPNMANPLKEAYETWDSAIKSLPKEKQIAIFGTDADIYYSVEILDSRVKNVVNYSSQNLVIHTDGHALYDKKTGSPQEIDIEENFKILKQTIDNLPSQNFGSFKLVNQALTKLKALDDKTALEIVLKKIEKIQQQYKLNDASTIGDYIKTRLMFLKTLFPNLEQKLLIAIINKIMGTAGFDIRKFGSSIPPEYKEKISLTVNNASTLLSEAIKPLEIIIHDFAVELLRGIESLFIVDNKKETENLKKEVAAAIAAIENSGNEDAIKILKQNFEKLKKVDNITSTIEGLVFQYNGNMYKFTGNFAPVNQILGLFKFGRGSKIPPMQHVVKESSKNKIYALFPGAFKPPHREHFKSVQILNDLSYVDEILVIISPSSRIDDTGNLKITAQQSEQIWKIFVKNMKKVKIEISKSESPVKSVYDFALERTNPGDGIAVAKGEREGGEHRFKRLEDFVLKHNLNIKITEINTATEASVSATHLRNAIIQNDKHFFEEYMPVHLNLNEKEQIWDIVRINTNQNTTVKEMSGMGAGAITGFASEKTKQMNKKIERKEFMKEILLREKIKHAIKNIFEEQKTKTNILREYVRKLICEEAKSKVQDTVHANTGINVLEDLLKKIIPSIEQDFKILTSSEEQRKSFRAHVLNAVSKTLTAADINANAGLKADDQINEQLGTETININTSDNPEQNDKFIDIEDKPEEEPDTFTIPGKDETGRNLAQTSYEKIEKNILDAYAILSDNEDKKLFYDYLLTNLKMYFDKFESELQTNLQEPQVNAQDAETENEPSLEI